MNAKCLLNPNIQVSTKVQINNSDVQAVVIDISKPGTAASLPPSLPVEGSTFTLPALFPTDGLFYVWVAEHTGDTRGLEWYTSLVMGYVDPTLPVQNSVNVDYS